MVLSVLLTMLIPLGGGWLVYRKASMVWKKANVKDKIENNIIQHILVDSYMNVTVHNFYAYGSKAFKKMLPDINIKKYGSNPLLLTYGICE